MQTTRVWALVSYLLAFALAPALSGGPVKVPESTLELRVAANPDRDAGILDIAGDQSQTVVYPDGRLVAKWVPVLRARAAEFTGDPAFVVRENGDGQTELLVLVGPNDLIDHVQRVAPAPDGEGRIGAVVEFDREGAAKLRVLTEESEGRHLAQIIGGVIYGAPLIVGAVYDQVMITGDFTEAEIAEMATDLGAAGSVQGPSVKSYIQLACLAALVAAGLFVLALGLLPAPGLKPSTHPRVWSVGMAACGGVIGGLWLGVDHHLGIVNLGSGFSTVGSQYTISILWVLVGAVTGVALGYLGGRALRFVVRRGVHNARRGGRRLFLKRAGSAGQIPK